MEPKTKKDGIAEAIMTGIIQGRYAPGEKFSEPRLAEHFAVSRAPIREALLELTKTGFVEQLPRRGFRVREMSGAEIADSYILMGVLEGFALAQSLERFFDSDFRYLEDLLAQMQQHIAAADILLLSRCDTKFHEFLRSKYSNSALSTSSLGAHLTPVHYIYFKQWSECQPLEHFHERHKKIVDAMRDGDGARIEKIVRDHYAETGYKMAQYMNRQGNAPKTRP